VAVSATVGSAEAVETTEGRVGARVARQVAWAETAEVVVEARVDLEEAEAAGGLAEVVEEARRVAVEVAAGTAVAEAEVEAEVGPADGQSVELAAVEEAAVAAWAAVVLVAEGSAGAAETWVVEGAAAAALAAAAAGARAAG